MMPIKETYQTELLTAINTKKKEMIELGIKYGLTDHRTIECSQTLDELITEKIKLDQKIPSKSFNLYGRYSVVPDNIY